MITLTVYLKTAKKPFIFEMNEKNLKTFYSDLENKSIITLGPLTFFSNDYAYSIATYKKIKKS